MKIFISWSKARSKIVADGLADLIRAVVKGAEPWVSFHRLSGGEEFVPRLHKHLNEAQFAIICITEDTYESPWIFYELGLLRRKGVKVCPYLIDPKMPHNRLPVLLPGRQSRRANKNDTLELVRDIKKRMVRRLSEGEDAKLEKTFDQHWPQFEEVLKKAQLRTVEDAFTFCRERVKDIIGLNNNLKKYVKHLKLAMWAVIPPAVALYDSRRAEIKARKREANPVFRELIDQIKQLAWDSIDEVRENFDEPDRVIGNVKQFLTDNYKKEDLEKFLITVAKTLDDDSNGPLREERLRKEIVIEINRVFLIFQQEAAKRLLTSFKF